MNWFQLCVDISRAQAAAYGVPYESDSNNVRPDLGDVHSIHQGPDNSREASDGGEVE